MVPDPTAERRTAFILLTFMALFFGGTWVAGKVAVDAIPPFTLAAVRFSVASILLWIWARSKTPTGRRPTAQDLPLIAAMGFTAVAAYNTLFLYGLKLAPASDGAIIVPGLAPIMTAAMALLILGERIGRWGVAGLITAFAGLVLVMNPGGAHAPGRLLGDLLFFLGAACWGIYSIMGKTALARFSPVNATLYATITGTLFLLPFAVAERGWNSLATAPVGSWIGALYLAVFGTVLAFVFFYEGVKRIGAARATTFAFLVPIFGVVSSVIMLGERLSASTIAGGALVLVGLWLVQRQPAVPAARLVPARDRPSG
jgi:drug/metabolite transporter (DMT)-like permease